MPNQLHVEILSYGAEIWNTWRNEDPNMVIELDQLDLSKLVSPGAVGNFIITNPFDDIDLSGANLIGSNLQGISLINADLRGADLIGANLLGASLHGANLSNANLNGAKLSGAYLLGAKLIGADLQ